MKKIEMKTTKMNVLLFDQNGVQEEKAVPFDYRKTLHAIIKAPADGVGVDEFRDRLKVLDKLEGDEPEIDFEDSEAATIARVVKAAKWKTIDRSIMEFIDDMTK